ncbi:MAG TPA: PhzF family phenazine biosynthesis protein [Candidatus Acidoferrales bacterium]|nr:PhzF family phenazine biosynthesis protein [Candidatus Acidoferrales bacterium]
MSLLPFYLVDVFSDQPLEGNPLALVPDAEQIDDATMRRLAREFNQSETTFLLPATRVGAECRLRCFTPTGQEVFGAGHNALGAWWWLAESGRLDLGQTGREFTQEIGDRLLPVEITCDAGRPVSVGMKQTAPLFGKTYDDLPEMAGALGLEVADVNVERLPIQVVFTGAPHMLVPLRDRSAIERARPDSARLLSILRSVDGEGCYLFSLDPVLPGSAAHARFFNPTVGIVEDAATGTAAGPLACQLVKKGVVKDGATIVIEQGYAMGRPSLIKVAVSGSNVRVEGRGFVVAEGNLRLF